MQQNGIGQMRWVGNKWAVTFPVQHPGGWALAGDPRPLKAATCFRASFVAYGRTAARRVKIFAIGAHGTIGGEADLASVGCFASVGTSRIAVRRY